MAEFQVHPDGSLTGTLPCGHDASELGAGWHWRIQCSACWRAYVKAQAKAEPVEAER